MKINKFFLLVLFVIIISACEKKSTSDGDNYVFVKSHCAMVSVGGFVGITEKCFNIGDTVIGKETIEGQIIIRIAAHSELNEGPPSPSSYQEFLNVSSDKLKKVNND